jgi:hypothetical protein
METTTSYDLNRAIQQWRENLAQSPAFGGENLDELESHLRDSIAALQNRSLSAEEAFMVGSKRVGQRGLLEAEFAKVNGQAAWFDRILWMLIGVQVWGFVSVLTTSMTQITVFFGLHRTNFNFAANGLIIPVMLLTVAQLLGLAGSLMVCWWLISRKGQNLGAWAARFLRRQGAAWAVAFAALCVLSPAALLMSFWMTALQSKITSVASFGQFMVSRSYSFFIYLFIQTATLAALTLLLARKRMRRSRA